MTEEQQEFLNTMIAAMRNEVISGMDPATHRQHHEYLKHRIEYLERQEVMIEKVKSSALGWFVITVLGGLGYIVWQGTKHVVGLQQ